MSVYPTNQNRHLYVVKGYNENVTASSGTGTIGAVKTIGEGNDKVLYFCYKSPGGVIKSDYIQLKNLDYVKLKTAWSMVRPLKKVQVQVSGSLMVGQDYVLRIIFRQFHGMGEDNTYIKDAVVHVTSSNKATFYAAMKDALNRSFSREVGATKDSNPYLKFTSSSEDLCIYEKVQPWTRGIGKQERVYFEVQPTTVYDESTGEDVIWGVAREQTWPLWKDDGNGNQVPNAYKAPVIGTGTADEPQYPEVAGIKVGFGDSATGLPNSREIADLEWFCMGERGDQYRMVGWPDYIPTTYLMDDTFSSLVEGFNVLEIHHAFTDTGVNSYRGEKDITIVAPNTVAGNVAMNAFIDTLETATGLSFATLLPNS